MVSSRAGLPVDEYVCQQPIEQGPCKAADMQWAFSAEEGGCVEFMYGGCGGNYNNFDDEAACVQACVEDIPLPSPGTIDKIQVGI